MERMLRLKKVSKKYGKHLAVKNISFEVAPCSTMGLIGPNGAGKTTTLNLISGILAPLSGSISICGYDLSINPLAAKQKLAYIPDDPIFFEQLTAREYCEFIASVYRMKQEEARAKINNWLSLLKLDNRANDLIETFSHGMRKKLQLAAACLHSPKVIIMDEPTSGLDPEMIYLVKQLLQLLRKQGVATLLATHDLALAEETCTHVCILYRGRMHYNGELKSLMTAHPDSTLEDIFIKIIGADKLRKDLASLVDSSFNHNQDMEKSYQEINSK